MRILVIGATGFIGPHVVRALARDRHTLAVYTRGSSNANLPADVTRIVGDRRAIATDADRLRAFAPELVIDLILSSGDQAAAMMNVFRGVARRVVAASSCDVYRACGVLHGLEEGPLEPVPLTEGSPVRTKLQTYPAAQLLMLQNIFGWLDDRYDKIPVERTLLSDSRLAGTVLRLPMIYGPGDPLHRFFQLVKRMDEGRPAIVFEEDTAAWRGPKGYVENVADAIALAAVSEPAAGRLYNVAEPEALTELQWAREAAAVTGWRGEFVVQPAGRASVDVQLPGNLKQHWVTDSSRIRRELGYRETVSRDEALRRTIAWERANPPAHLPS